MLRESYKELGEKTVQKRRIFAFIFPLFVGFGGFWLYGVRALQ